MIRLTATAREALGTDRVLVFDWHRLAICCAAAGEVQLRRAPRGSLRNRPAYRPLDSDPAGTVYAHRQALPHLAGRDVTVDCRRWLGVSHFTTDLPDDFGLRVSLGRLT